MKISFDVSTQTIISKNKKVCHRKIMIHLKIQDASWPLYLL